MKGVLSFHAVDVGLFDDLLGALLRGGRVNPERFLQDAIRMRHNWAQSSRYQHSLELAIAEPEAAGGQGGGLWRNLRGRLEELTQRPDQATRLAREVVEVDLHLEGRPFFISEGSAETVADLVDAYRTAETTEQVDAIGREQLVRLSPELARSLPLVEADELSADFGYRSDLLSELKDLYDIGNAARQGGRWGREDRPPRPAVEVLAEEVPWRAVALHARVAPFWMARDVDGLETVRRAAEIEAPEFLVPAWRLFSESCEAFPGLRETLGVEVDGPRGVGAFVAPADVQNLLDFLASAGARIIQAATRHGEGAACRTLLRKVRECATYAARHDFGYLEASGVLPPDRDPPD